jgi:hypothetical protein
MNQHYGQPFGSLRFRLPMAMTEHTAAIGWIYLDSFRLSRELEGWPGKKISNDGLQVGVGQAAARLKGRQPSRRQRPVARGFAQIRRNSGGITVKPCIFFDIRDHGGSVI